MKRTFFITLIMTGFFIVAVHPVAAKNPFKSFLPQKPKEDVSKVEEEKKRQEEEERIRREKEMKAQEQARIEAMVPPVMTLEGLIWNSDIPQAIINGQVVKVGDVVQEVVIKKISRDGVMGDFKGKPVHLKP